jgi:hypothetical protein
MMLRITQRRFGIPRIIIDFRGALSLSDAVAGGG